MAAADPNRQALRVSDKASIIIDTIETLNDFMIQVDRLKAEYVTLSQDSCEVLMLIDLTSAMVLLLLDPSQVKLCETVFNNLIEKVLSKSTGCRLSPN